ncbi:acyl-CoA carboxylase subunit beta [Geomonas nitrogeniifigens]|uniref:Acyl-CoA carboxylase subunit beta n=1 Tax=Geomonas diazotrophica TaxID=2843197 RepID=A0ABX8JJ52_9BACT|nr:carboxyl transferase domain-containing protein [Geomonas nitrogeniifigens]QWV97768.1 acyl-CoA carboxylase subunit beta [Geomonas nitrogeniifigens]QXE86908.1 acyl-CoA carboxylase subunit beta [Geomonas nitrogeniifigens]
MSIDEKVKELNERKERLKLGGGRARIDQQHAQQSLTARERIETLVDKDSFQEVGLFARHRCTNFGMAGKEFPAEGVVTGAGTVAGRLVHLASQDFTVAGGSAGEVHSDKIVQAMQSALKTGTPFVFMNDSGGARIQEGIDSLAGYGKIFYHNVMLSGVVPQISLICGPCAGGAAYSPALTDFIIQTASARMFITGPSVIKEATGEEITAEALGGPLSQMNYAGVAHFVAENDLVALRICKRLLSFLPSNNLEDPPQLQADDIVVPDKTLNTLVPTDSKKAYDVRQVINRLVDGGDFLEVQPLFAGNLVVGFARILGRSVGVVANQPSVLAGALDINASDKGARFVRFCNAFNIPLITLVDVPGFLPGVQQEQGGIIRHGAKMLFAYSAATVPKITVIMRKAYGGAFLAMCGKELETDRVFAWPTAEIAVMGPQGAVNVIFRNEIAQAEDPQKRRQELIESYQGTFATPYAAAARRDVDDIIEPAETRRHLAMTLDILHTKREFRPMKKHGLIPL